MTKSEVLAAVGNPSRSGRSAGADRWSYDVRDSHKRKVDTIDVYFSEGQVQFVGSEANFQKQLESKGTKAPTDESQFRDL